MALTTKRLNWLEWLYPGPDGLLSEQGWHIDKRRNHMLNDHSAGVVDGLEVLASGSPDLWVHVQPGRAIDGIGEEVVLAGVVDVDLTSYAVTGATVKIVAEFAETGTDQYIVDETATAQDKFLQDTPTISAIIGAPSANQIVLAQVVVSNGATAIEDAVDPDNPGTDEIDLTVTEYSTLSRDASETVKGVVELATQAEVYAGIDATRVVTPATFQIPFNYIGGLITSNGTDFDHDIDIAAGAARSADDVTNMKLAAVLTKQIDAFWSVGSGAGGLDSDPVVVAADTLYAIWLIKRSDTGVVDALFSTSFTAPTMPTDYDSKRLIAAVMTDGSANIIEYTQVGDYFRYIGEVIEDVSDSTITSNVFATGTLSVPPSAIADIYGYVGELPGGIDVARSLLIKTKGAPDAATPVFAFASHTSGSAVKQIAAAGQVLVDENRQVEYAAGEIADDVIVVINTFGFTMLTRREP